MPINYHAGALLCVVLIAAGQVLFKQTAAAVQQGGAVMAWRPALFGAGAMAIYLVATALWVHLLRAVPLGRIYPYMALSFLIVPLASWWTFGERIEARQLLGMLLIMAGIAVTATAPVR